MMRLLVSSTATLLLVFFTNTNTCNAQWSAHSYTGGAVALGMAFDKATNIGMVVGGAYQETFGLFSPGNGPRCLVGVFDNAQGMLTHRLGFTDLEVCTHVVNVGGRKGMLLGYQPLETAETGVTTEVGEVFGTLDLVGTPPTSSFHAIASGHRITYPVQGVLNQDGSAMFVAFHQTDTVPSSLKDQTLDPLSQILSFQDEMHSGNEDSRNAIWSPGVQKWNVATNELEWTVSVTTDDRVAVLSSVVHVAQGGFLLVGGYSKGSRLEIESPFDTWNGFLTKIDPLTGTPIVNGTKYIISQDRKNDIVRDICVSGNYAFVVGGTQGIFEGIHAGGAFLFKVDVTTLDIIWQRQIPGEGVDGIFCAVHHDDDDDDIVYIGGTVPENIEVEIGKGSTGRDIFVAQVATENATIFWTRQFGSDTHVTISGLATDQDGDVVLCGNSFNETAWKNDAFVLTMNRKDGAHEPKWIQLLLTPEGEDTSKDRKGLIIAGSIILPILLAIIVLWCEYNRRGPIEAVPKDHQEAEPTPVLKDAQVS
jgi:hypothetical protein